MSILFFALPGNDLLASRLAELGPGEVGTLELRNFPDGETYLRFANELGGQSIVLVCTLDHPNAKIPALLFAARAARELGAARVGLVAPYLCYMRQDSRFLPGEAVTSRGFAALLSHHFDWLVTVDPHLHRYKSLDEIYTIPTRVLHAGEIIAGWINKNICNPVLIGPDAESRQWVELVASACGAPWTVLEKTRMGDQRVQETSLSLPLAGRSPVLLDDIISSGATALEAVAKIKSVTPLSTTIIAIHALCGRQAEEALNKSGARLVSTNSVPNPTAVMDITPLLAAGVEELVTDRRDRFPACQPAAGFPKA